MVIIHKLIIDIHYNIMDSKFINLEPITKENFIIINNHMIALILAIVILLVVQVFP